MDEILYNSITQYYNTLSKLGHISYDNAYKILLLSFYRDFALNDYRGLISKDDYLTIEKALNCLFGTTCLIPYPDYLKMGKLHLGEISELAQRVKALEDTEVVKAPDTVDIEVPDITINND
jgi:hypothetical protein